MITAITVTKSVTDVTYKEKEMTAHFEHPYALSETESWQILLHVFNQGTILGV